MLSVINSIILHTTKYTDSSFIITAYTKEYGRKSFIANLSQKGALKKSLFTPLNQLELEAYEKPGQKLGRIKSARIKMPYHHIPTNVVKSSICLFCAEILFKIEEQSENNAFFEFLCQAFSYLDYSTKEYHQFSLNFLVKLMPYLGFSPIDEGIGYNNTKELETVEKIIQTPLTEMPLLEKSLYKELLQNLSSQYKTNLLNNKNIKSLSVLEELFTG